MEKFTIVGFGDKNQEVQEAVDQFVKDGVDAPLRSNAWQIIDPAIKSQAFIDGAKKKFVDTKVVRKLIIRKDDILVLGVELNDPKGRVILFNIFKDNVKMTVRPLKDATRVLFDTGVLPRDTYVFLKSKGRYWTKLVVESDPGVRFGEEFDIGNRDFGIKRYLIDYYDYRVPKQKKKKKKKKKKKDLYIVDDDDDLGYEDEEAMMEERERLKQFSKQAGDVQKETVFMAQYRRLFASVLRDTREKALAAMGLPDFDANDISNVVNTLEVADANVEELETKGNIFTDVDIIDIRAEFLGDTGLSETEIEDILVRMLKVDQEVADRVSHQIIIQSKVQSVQPIWLQTLQTLGFDEPMANKIVDAMLSAFEYGTVRSLQLKRLPLTEEQVQTIMDAIEQAETNWLEHLEDEEDEDFSLEAEEVKDDDAVDMMELEEEEDEDEKAIVPMQQLGESRPMELEEEEEDDDVQAISPPPEPMQLEEDPEAEDVDILGLSEDEDVTPSLPSPSIRPFPTSMMRKKPKPTRKPELPPPSIRPFPTSMMRKKPQTRKRPADVEPEPDQWPMASLAEVQAIIIPLSLLGRPGRKAANQIVTKRLSRDDIKSNVGINSGALRLKMELLNPENNPLITQKEFRFMMQAFKYLIEQRVDPGALRRIARTFFDIRRRHGSIREIVWNVRRNGLNDDTLTDEEALARLPLPETDPEQESYKRVRACIQCQIKPATIASRMDSTAQYCSVDCYMEHKLVL